MTKHVFLVTRAYRSHHSLPVAVKDACPFEEETRS